MTDSTDVVERAVAQLIDLSREDCITLGVGSNAMLPGTAELAARLETFR